MPGRERDKGPDDRHEASEHDRRAAPLRVKLLRGNEIVVLEEPPIFLAERLRPDKLADMVIHRVTENRRKRKKEDRRRETKNSDGRKRAKHEYHRIARQKRRHDEAGLAENDDEKQGIHPDPVIGRERAQVRVEMHDKIENAHDELHITSLRESSPYNR